MKFKISFHLRFFAEFKEDFGYVLSVFLRNITGQLKIKNSRFSFGRKTLNKS